MPSPLFLRGQPLLFSYPVKENHPHCGAGKMPSCSEAVVNIFFKTEPAGFQPGDCTPVACNGEIGTRVCRNQRNIHTALFTMTPPGGSWGPGETVSPGQPRAAALADPAWRWHGAARPEGARLRLSACATPVQPGPYMALRAGVALQPYRVDAAGCGGAAPGTRRASPLRAPLDCGGHSELLMV